MLLVAETSQNLRAVGYAKKFHFVTSLIILPFLHSSSLLLSVSLVLTDWTLLEAPVELVDIEASLYFGFLNWSVLLALSPLLKANVHAVSVAAEAQAHQSAWSASLIGGQDRQRNNQSRVVP